MWLGAPSSRSRPFRNEISSRNDHPITSAPSFRASSPAASRFLPSPGRRPRSSTRSPAASPSRWHSSASVPYSSAYSSFTRSHGSFPGFRSGHEARPKRGRHCPAEDEPPGLDPDDVGDSASGERLRHSRDHVVQERGVTQDRRDVLEDDPGLGVVLDGPERVADPCSSVMVAFIGCRSSWRKRSRPRRPVAPAAPPARGRAPPAAAPPAGRAPPRRPPAATTSTRPSGRFLAYPPRPSAARVPGDEPAEPHALHLPETRNRVVTPAGSASPGAPRPRSAAPRAR